MQDPKIDVNVEDRNGNTPIYRAIHKRNLNIMKILLNHPLINASKKNGFGSTLLHAETTASNNSLITNKEGDVRILNHLIKYCSKLDVNATKFNGETALYMACFNGNYEAVKALCQHPAIFIDFTIDGLYGPLIFGRAPEYDKIVNVLIQTHFKRRNIDLKAAKMNGWNLLHLACHYGDLDVVKILSGRKLTDIYAKTNYGETPLHIACNKENIDVVKHLLELESIKIYIGDNNGKSALDIALLLENFEMVKLLQPKRRRL